MGASNIAKESAQAGLPNKASETANGGSEAEPFIDFRKEKLYKLPDGTPKLGTEILQALGRGIGYDNLKSKYDKQYEELKKISAELDMLKSQNAMLQQQSMVERTVRDYIPKKSSQYQEDVDDLFTEGTESQPQDYKAMMADIQRKFEGTLAQYKKEIEDTANGVKENSSKYIEEQEREKVRTTRLSALDKADLDMLKEQYPDVSDLTIERISKLKKEVRTADLNTIALAEGKLDNVETPDGKLSDWSEVWSSSKVLHDEYLKAVKAADREQEAKSIEKDRESGVLFNWQTDIDQLNADMKDPAKNMAIPTQEEYKQQVAQGLKIAKAKLDAMRTALTRKTV